MSYRIDYGPRRRDRSPGRRLCRVASLTAVFWAVFLAWVSLLCPRGCAVLMAELEPVRQWALGYG